MKTSFLILVLSSMLYCQYPLSFSFEVGEGAANTAMLRGSSFPIVYDATLLGVSYHFELKQPRIVFKNNHIQFIATLLLIYGNNAFQYEISPSIRVNYTVSSTHLTATLENLRQHLETVMQGVDPIVKDKVFELYGLLELELYPGKIIAASSSLIPAELNIELTSFSYSFVASEGKLTVLITYTADGRVPNLTAYTFHSSQIKLKPTVQATIKNILVINTLGEEIFSFNGQQIIQRDGEYIWSVSNALSDGMLLRVTYDCGIRGRYNSIFSLDVDTQDAWRVQSLQHAIE